MSFTDDNNLEIPTTGAADWDGPLSSNFTALGRGFEFKATAGFPVNTGDAICLLGNFVRPYDASSLDAPRPIAVSRTSVGSGEASQFMVQGVVRSLELWSGHVTRGEPVFVDPASPGFLVNCYSAARRAVGWAVDVNAVLVKPFDPLTEETSQVVSFAFAVGSAHDFEVEVGHRGMVRRLTSVSDSVDAYKIRFWSGSSRVSSELLYETVTTSVDAGAQDFDVNTLEFLDRSVWAILNTDTASPGLVFGTIDVQSASSVASGDASLTLVVERFA